ncbi:MAG: hypothetical protein COV66_06315 [Nitrospinae bacterium CG11_big_fil_rev_8_21_14_0_20_45_15]|nr:MAG: hypothetical protein COV66_06315 [Nitrospinae bacterium CG11_big_fil_rev_8_21_14_0_20_45_15]
MKGFSLFTQHFQHSSGVFLATLFFLFLGLGGSSCASVPTIPRLLLPLPGTESTQPPVIRSRRVNVVWSILNKNDNALEVTSLQGQSFLLNLFDDVELTCKVERIDLHKNGSLSLAVSFPGLPSTSNAILTFKDNIMVGAVFLPEKQYRIRYSEFGYHIVDEINPLKFPTDAAPIPVP